METGEKYVQKHERAFLKSGAVSPGGFALPICETVCKSPSGLEVREEKYVQNPESFVARFFLLPRVKDRERLWHDAIGITL